MQAVRRLDRWMSMGAVRGARADWLIIYRPTAFALVRFAQRFSKTLEVFACGNEAAFFRANA